MESDLLEYASHSQNSVIQREASGTATGSRRELVEGIKAYSLDTNPYRFGYQRAGER